MLHAPKSAKLHLGEISFPLASFHTDFIKTSRDWTILKLVRDMCPNRTRNAVIKIVMHTSGLSNKGTQNRQAQKFCSKCPYVNEVP